MACQYRESHSRSLSTLYVTETLRGLYRRVVLLGTDARAMLSILASIIGGYSGNRAMDHHEKLTWACKHLDRLEQEIRAFIESGPYTPLFEKQVEPGEWVTRITVRHAIPAYWSLIVGDVLHNLRSALDNLAYALVEKESGPPPKPTHVQFPIFDAPDDFKAKRKRYLAGMNARAVAVIEGLQPFNRPDRKWHSLLSLLNHLSKIDKHRHIIVTTMAGAMTNIRVDGMALVPERTTVVSRKVPIVDGAILARIRTEGPVPAKVTMRADIPVDVQFGGERPVKGASVHGVLEGIHDHIRDTVFVPLDECLK
mgnify:CR=1 FL=1